MRSCERSRTAEENGRRPDERWQGRGEKSAGTSSWASSLKALPNGRRRGIMGGRRLVSSVLALVTPAFRVAQVIDIDKLAGVIQW